MPAGARIEELGVRFVLDRQGRPVTPAMEGFRRGCTESWALRGVDLTIEPGDGIAVIGRNGAGKTTLLRTLAGVMVPDEGEVEVNGRVAAMLNATGGMAVELTGRENSITLCMLLGLPRTAAREIAPAINRRSGLNGAFDRPLSTYSWGMRVRLAYSAICEVDCDLLLLDEIRGSMDHEFRAAMEAHARELRERGGAVAMAGHDHEVLRRICNEALLLEGGRVVARGPFEEVQARYLKSGINPGKSGSAVPA